MHPGSSCGDGGERVIGHPRQLLCLSLAVLWSPPRGNPGAGPRSRACAEGRPVREEVFQPSFGPLARTEGGESL